MPLSQGIITAQETVLAANCGYERHPDSYPLRVFAYVMAETRFYELLMTGEAIVWGGLDSPPPDTMEYWLVDVPTIHSLGVHRAR